MLGLRYQDSAHRPGTPTLEVRDVSVAYTALGGSFRAELYYALEQVSFEAETRRTARRHRTQRRR